MKNKSIFLLIILALCLSNLKAQKIKEPAIAKQYKYSIGIAAGSTTGCGVSFRFIPKRIGFQATLLPISSNYGDDMIVNSGLTLLGRITEAENTNLYVYLANNYIYNRSTFTGYNWVNNNYEEYTTKTETGKWNTGVGVGVEFATTKRVVMNMMIGFGQYNTFQTITFAGELGLYYRFNKKSAEKKKLD
ncbi:MAG: hypothetical protein HXX09_14485 [Bacteroidetes bacterium]|nr:hypothetical protein [Bacteroidota bacterium]